MTDSEYRIANKHLNYFETNIPSVLTHFQITPLNSAQWFTRGILQRLHDSSASLRILLPEYQKSPVHDFSIGIILRPIILDTIIGLNLLTVLKSGLSEKLESKILIEKIDSFCNAALADGLIRTLRYFEQLDNYGLAGQGKLFETYNHFATEYTDFLTQTNGINTMPQQKHKNMPKAKDLFANLADDEDMKPIGHRLYGLYIIYSKYDHFSFLSFELNNDDNETKSGRISEAISLFVNHYANMCDILQRVTPNDTLVTDLLLSSKKYLSTKNEMTLNLRIILIVSFIISRLIY